MSADKTFRNSKYPNPYLGRDDFMSLNGTWHFSFSAERSVPATFEKNILVPFPYESPLSGIGDETSYSSLWYKRTISLKKHNGRILLHFLSVDYECYIFVNNHEIAYHRGGYVPFAIDITDFSHEGINEIAVHALDDLSRDQMRGKQRSTESNHDCWYSHTSGICQSVFLEYAGEHPTTGVALSPSNGGNVSFKIENEKKEHTIRVLDENGAILKTIETTENEGSFAIDNPRLWSEKEANLYYLEVETAGEPLDKVSTCFGFRHIEARESKLFLNGELLYLRLILNQGYYPGGLTTAKGPEVFLQDIKLMKEIGFNGARMHQKIEDPHYYYYCDCLGFYGTAEVPSFYELNERSKKEVRRDLPLLEAYLYNSPSVLLWLLFNESWGIPTIGNDPKTYDFVNSIGDLARKFSGNRLVITNDGWNSTSETDILSLHEYEQDGTKLKDELSDKAALLANPKINKYGPAFVEGHEYRNQPIMISEFGGVSLRSSDGWGYGEKASDVDDFLKRLSSLFSAVYAAKFLSGFCYTQLTDVYQESNGLLFFDRSPKAELKAINEIVRGNNDEKK